MGIVTKMVETAFIAILFVSGSGKLLLILREAQVLRVDDPIFGVENYRLLLIVGASEVCCALWCLLSWLKNRTSAMPLALISAAILSYRAMLYIVGFSGYCNCLGVFAEGLPISQSTLSGALLVVALSMYIYSISSMIHGFVGARLTQHSSAAPSE